MASAPHRVADQRATVPPIVLPITSRGLAVTDRLCWVVLGAAMVVAAGLVLYLNRGTTFFLDELVWVYGAPGLSGAGEVLEPHNGHLIATSRLVYRAILEAFGAEYVVFRLLAVSTVLLSAGLLYALVRRRIGALPALAPALVLLFLGSAWQHVLVPIGFTVVFSVAAGLAALLALERDDRRGDVAACALLVLSVATYTTGLAFLVGVAISVLIRDDRRRRAWIFLVPLVLYAAWWVWALGAEQSSEGETRVSNALLIPSYIADSLAAVVGAVTGLDTDFEEPGPFLELGWGRALAPLAVVALAVRFRGRRPPALLWIGLGIVLAYWSLGALAAGTEARAPWAVRYMYTGSVGVLLIAAAAGAGIRFSRLGLGILFAATAISLATNVAFLRDGGTVFRNQYSTPTRAQFAVIELARDHVDPGFDPEIALPDESQVGSPAAAYLAVVDRYGSLGFSAAELQRQGEGVRQFADRLLASALRVRLEESVSKRPSRGCETVRSDGPGGESVPVEIPPGGAILRAVGDRQASVALRRFADVAAAEIGTVPEGDAATLRIPTDSNPGPWQASVSGARSVEVCPLR
jgi:hypothetical protein